MSDASVADTNMQIATDAYAAFAAGDVKGFFAAFDDNTELIEAGSLPYGGVYKGAENAEQGLMAIGAAWVDIDYQVIDMIANDRHVVAYGRFAATARNSGTKVDMPLVEIWAITDEVVQSITVLYFDTQRVNEALATE